MKTVCIEHGNKKQRKNGRAILLAGLTEALQHLLRKPSKSDVTSRYWPRGNGGKVKYMQHDINNRRASPCNFCFAHFPYLEHFSLCPENREAEFPQAPDLTTPVASNLVPDRTIVSYFPRVTMAREKGRATGGCARGVLVVLIGGEERKTCSS